LGPFGWWWLAPGWRFASAFLGGCFAKGGCSSSSSVLIIISAFLSIIQK
jgi:hypothetical protein